jgi:Carbohydrate-selective porin, OprB family
MGPKCVQRLFLHPRTELPREPRVRIQRSACTCKIRSWFDVLGVAFAYGHLRNNPQDDEGRSNPGYEIVMEGTYQIEFAPWLSLQPDVQYVIHPSGTNIANALVLGARTTGSF